MGDYHELRKVIVQLKPSHILQQSFMNELILVLLKNRKWSLQNYLLIYLPVFGPFLLAGYEWF